MKKILRGISGAFVLMAALITLHTGYAFASNTPSLTQVISAGALAVDIRDATGTTVGTPSFAMTPLLFSFQCQTSTGALGSDSQRMYVTNPGAATNGWTLAVAATAGPTATWSNSGNTQKLDFNDPTTAGCTDGADTDTLGGQMTLNPTAGTLTADCGGGCTTTGITKGTATAFSEGTTDSVTLLNASSSANANGQWYLGGVGVSQTIPANQPIENYSVNLTVTVTAS